MCLLDSHNCSDSVVVYNRLLIEPSVLALLTNDMCLLDCHNCSDSVVVYMFVNGISVGSILRLCLLDCITVLTV